MNFMDLRRLIIFTCLMFLENVVAMNIIDVLKNNEGKTFVNLAEIAGLRHKLETETLTVFAPSDKAFQRLPVFLMEMLRQDNATLHTMMTYHIVQGAVTTDGMKNNRKLIALSGLPIRLNIYKARKLILVEGTMLEFQYKTASNGVVHIMDRIMRPPHGTIMDILQADPDNNIFVGLIKKANLQNLLSDKNSNLTVFAPTNSAFSDPLSKLYLGNVKDTKVLKAILSYHILPKILYQLAISNGTHASSLLNTKDKLRFRNYDLGLHVENALITLSDSSATNGVVHQIDSILIPPSLLQESGVTMNSNPQPSGSTDGRKRKMNGKQKTRSKGQNKKKNLIDSITSSTNKPRRTTNPPRSTKKVGHSSTNKQQTNISTTNDVSTLSDLSTISDFSTIKDVSTINDLPALHDLSIINDLSTVNDLSTTYDLTSINDLSPITDLSPRNDLSILHDVATTNDLSTTNTYSTNNNTITMENNSSTTTNNPPQTTNASQKTDPAQTTIPLETTSNNARTMDNTSTTMGNPEITNAPQTTISPVAISNNTEIITNNSSITMNNSPQTTNLPQTTIQPVTTSNNTRTIANDLSASNNNPPETTKLPKTTYSPETTQKPK